MCGLVYVILADVCYVMCIGSAAANNATKLHEGDRIKLGDCDVSTRYDAQKKVTYTNFKLFSFETDSNSGSGQQDQTAPQPVVDDGEVDEERLPF